MTPAPCSLQTASSPQLSRPSAAHDRRLGSSFGLACVARDFYIAVPLAVARSGGYRALPSCRIRAPTGVRPDTSTATRRIRQDGPVTETEPRRFTAGGPFEVPTRGSKGNRSLDRDALRRFWGSEAEGWDKEKGCYVFALRRGPGYLPVYVGKTNRSFAKECFTDRNYRLLHEAVGGQVGTLVLFLLRYEPSRGKHNAASIRDLEKYLVEAALERNPNLWNRQWARTTQTFAVRGIHKDRGRPSIAAVELKRALGLSRRS